jgi:hypothetical protein
MISDIRESLGKPYRFTEFVDFVDIEDNKGTRRTLRTTDNVMPKGIYQLYLPKFGVLYLGISGVDTDNSRMGVKNRLYSHAQKMTGMFKGAQDTRAFKEFREAAVEQGYDLETILDKVLVFFLPCDKMNKTEIEAWETVIYNSLKSRGQCRFNSAKRIQGMDHLTLDFVLNQEYLNDTAQYYV